VRLAETSRDLQDMVKGSACSARSVGGAIMSVDYHHAVYRNIFRAGRQYQARNTGYRAARYATSAHYQDHALGRRLACRAYIYKPPRHAP
jgi:hypothetical protein